MARKKKTKQAEDEHAKEILSTAMISSLPGITPGNLLTEKESGIPRQEAPTVESLQAAKRRDRQRIRDIMEAALEAIGPESAGRMHTYMEVADWLSVLNSEYMALEMDADLVEHEGKMEIHNAGEQFHALQNYRPAQLPVETSDELALANDVDLDKLYDILGPEHSLILKESGAFHHVAFDQTQLMDSLIYWYSPVVQAVMVQPDVTVHSKPDTSPQATEHLCNELRYINTILPPLEAKNLASDLVYELLAKRPITHLDLSDMITDALGPSLAHEILVGADAVHQYSAAQYLQVYQSLREAQLTYQIDLLSSRLDGMMAGVDSVYWSAHREKDPEIKLARAQARAQQRAAAEALAQDQADVQEHVAQSLAPAPAGAESAAAN